VGAVYKVSHLRRVGGRLHVLPRDPELVAEHGQGGGAPVVEAVAPDEDVPMTLGEPPDGLPKGGSLHLAHHLPGSVGRSLVLYELPWLGGILSQAQGPVEAGSGRGNGFLGLPHLIYLPLKALGHLFVCGFAPELCRELV
jgi:hypothetical protein